MASIILSLSVSQTLLILYPRLYNIIPLDQLVSLSQMSVVLFVLDPTFYDRLQISPDHFVHFSPHFVLICKHMFGIMKLEQMFGGAVCYVLIRCGRSSRNNSEQRKRVRKLCLLLGGRTAFAARVVTMLMPM